MKELLEQYFTALRSLSPQESEMIRFRTLDSYERQVLQIRGFFHILFLGGNEHTRYGLRIMPDRSWLDWPVVKVNDVYSCSTIAPRIANLFEFLKLDRMTPSFRNLNHQVKIAKRHDEIVGPIAKIFGNEDGFCFLNEFMATVKKQGKIISREKSDQFIVDFWSHYDTSEEHIFLRDALTNMIRDKDFYPEIDTQKNYGIWQSRIYHLILSRINYKSTVDKEKVSMEMIFKSFDEPNCYDIEHRPTCQISDVDCDPFRIISACARTIIEGNLFEDEPDPICYVISGFYKAGAEYTGMDHLKVGAFLDEVSKEPLRAWNAIVNAAYWTGMLADDEPMYPVWELGVNLCKRNKWTDAQYALEYQMGIYEELANQNRGK